MLVKSIGLSKGIPVPHILVLALGLFCANGQEKKAEPAPSTAPAKSSDSYSKALKQNGLNELEKSIFGSMKDFGEGGGSDPLVNRKLPRPAPAPDKQTKEILDRRKNWAFMTPEELVIGRSTLEAFDLQGKDKDEESKYLSPMERYYQRLLNKDNASPGNGNRKDGASEKNLLGGKSSLSPLGGPDEQDQDDSFSGLPASVRDTQRTLRMNKEKEKDAASQHHGFGFFSDVFALERKPSPEEEKQERERMNAYRKSLGLDSLPTFESPFKKELEAAKDPYRIVPPTMMGLPSVSSATPITSASTPTGFKASPFSEPAPKLAGSPSLSPVPPKIDPPKSVLPPNPTFAAPRRPF